MSIFPMGSNAQALKFEQEGQVFSGVLIAPPTQRQLTDYGTNNPRLDKHGNPMMGIVMTLRSDEGEERTVYMDSKSMQYEAGDAIRRAGVGSEEVGGRFTIKYLGKQQVKWAAQPTNMYEMTYEPPAPGSVPAPQPFPASPEAVQQPPAPPVEQPPAEAVQAPPAAAQQPPVGAPAAQPPAGDPWGGQQPAPATTNPWA